MSETPPTRREHEMIFHLLKSRPERPQTIALAEQDLDWEYFFRTAEEHRIVPIVFKNIKPLPPGMFPENVVEKFRSQYKLNAAMNFARSTQLIKLVGHLQDNQVPVIAYKGMALAEFAYGDTTLRQFGDIDLFIRKKDFFKAKELFRQLECTPAWDLTESQEKAVLRYHYEYPFHFGDTDTLIELHWEFVETFFAFDFEFEEIWDRTVSVDLFGTEIRTLSAEDYLIVLTSHGSKHFWKRLSWVCDVARLIENQAIDWDVTIRRASRYGSLRMVWLGCHLAVAILKSELPEKVSQLIASDRTINPLADRFMKSMFEVEKEPSNWTGMARIHLKMREKTSTKLRYGYRLLTTKAVDSLFLPLGRPR